MLAALAGTAVDRLFLGGPLDGEVRTMAPDRYDVVALWPAEPVTSAWPRECYYRARLFGMPEVGGRFVMVAQDVQDVDRALFQWLAKRWLAEAPERTP